MSSLSKLERAFASTFFGKPPNSSFEDALGFFLEAEKGKSIHFNHAFILAEPGHTYTVCRIAQCYEKLGRKQEAKEWAMQAIKLHAQDSETAEFQNDCRRIAAQN